MPPKIKVEHIEPGSYDDPFDHLAVRDKNRYSRQMNSNNKRRKERYDRTIRKQDREKRRKWIFTTKWYVAFGNHNMVEINLYQHFRDRLYAVKVIAVVEGRYKHLMTNTGYDDRVIALHDAAQAAGYQDWREWRHVCREYVQDNNREDRARRDLGLDTEEHGAFMRGELADYWNEYGTRDDIAT